jgi:5-methylcytosine-specific restriction endonuclease McrA
MKNNKLITWLTITNRCKNKQIKLQMTKQEFFQWYDNQIRQCIYCGILEEDWLKTKDSMLKIYKHLHVDRKNNKIGYKISNIVLACPRCNLTKNDFFTYKDMLKIGDIIHAYQQPI